MKVGTENKKKTIAAIALMILAALSLVYELYTPGQKAAPTTAAQIAKTTAKPQPAAKSRSRDPQAKHIAVVWTPSLDPRLRLDLLKESEGIKYEGAGRNIFREHLEEIPQPVASGLKNNTVKPVATAPTGPPPPPPINLKFYGWASGDGNGKAVFLSQGDDVFIAHEGDIIARRYKVVRISPNSVEIQDVLSNNTQSIPLTQG